MKNKTVDEAARSAPQIFVAAALLAVLVLPVAVHSAEAAKKPVSQVVDRKATTKATTKTAISKNKSTNKSTASRKSKKQAAANKHQKYKKVTTSEQDRAAQNEMAHVQEQIRSAEERIKLTKDQREQKELELKQAEIEIGTLRNSVGAVQTDVRVGESHLSVLQAERAQRLNDKSRLVNLIRADLQMAQRQGGQDYYKMLLNQQDPQTVARQMRYYEYLQKARAERVHALNETVVRLDAIAREEEDGVRRLRSLRGELQEKQSHLTSAQQQRTQAIRVLNTQIESEDEKLQKLRRDQQALQLVMDRLAREAIVREQQMAERRRQEQARAAQQAQAGQATRPVDSHKNEAPDKVAKTEKPDTDAPVDFKLTPYNGRCALPVSGGVRSSFGASRAGGLRWNGIVIAADAGTPVRAIRPGRVAFADYLRGYGFLIIVDHGRGLMSLYGQNQSLQKKAGDDVGGNEVIATVGDSGGNEANGLYFEIRMRGRPSDPAGWCAFK